jgi:hypothetical protein
MLSFGNAKVRMGGTVPPLAPMPHCVQRENVTTLYDPQSVLNQIYVILIPTKPIPVAERSKALVCGRSLAGIEVSNSAGGKAVCLW